jgi:uncharacterized protein (UPF0216 family)
MNIIPIIECPEIIPNKQILIENNTEVISYDNEEYYINKEALDRFYNDILSTESKYVYPLVFVKFAKRITNKNKIYFDDDELYKLRIQANYLRDLSINNHHPDRDEYICFQLAKETVKNIR